MECNKEEAVRVKQLAEMKMMIKDFSGALKLAFRAQQLYPELENISQLIIVCEVNSAAKNKPYGADKDWYGILKVDPSADDMAIKRKYRKLALILHPDKNKFYGSTEAFKLIGEAQRLLLDREKRAILDGKLKAFGKCTAPNLAPKQPKSHFGKFRVTETQSRAANCEFTTKSVFENEKKVLAKKQGNVSMIGKKRKAEPVGSQRFDQQQPRRSTRPKIIVCYKESESRRSVQQVVECQRRIGDKKSKRGKRDTEEETGPEEIECPDPEFSDFEKQKKEETFSAGQIWACYDAEDAMPRLYAVIKKISPGFKLQIQWLEPDPTGADERKWVGQHLPVSCGRFKHGQQDKTQDLLSFSHLVEAGQKAKTLNIFPRKGETWAVFKNWCMNWNSGNKGAEERKYEYEIVEVLSDYDAKVGVRVSCLEKVKGFVCLFRRKKGGEMEIAAREKYRFAHMVPSCRMTGKERKGVPKGCYELDPAALPASTFE